MPSKNEFENALWRVTEIYLNAKENFNYCSYLHFPETQLEKQYVTIDRDLKFIRHSLWRLSIIELAKLFSRNSKNDKFNLLLFIKKLHSGREFEQLNISEATILDWKGLILSENETIKNVLTLRNKIYAHSDPDKDDFKSMSIYFPQIEKLLAIAESIIKEANLLALGRTADLRTPGFDRGDFDLVKILAENHQKQLDDLNKLVKEFGG